MNILVTAIGSMSAECVISSLKKEGHFVVGCDIYPGEWHYETKLCDKFKQAPLAKSVEYIPFLLDLVRKYNIEYLFPLTDLEIDVLTNKRDLFLVEGCTICISSKETISIVRNKYNLYLFFKDDNFVPSIKSWNTDESLNSQDFYRFPYIAKPCDGRSSEGLKKIVNQQELKNVLSQSNYLIQECVGGSVFTVDYVRQASTDKYLVIPRQELLRTPNGAGLTVKLINDDQLKQLTHYIGDKLNINGCVNMEFIYSEESNSYFLIDINPRFSAGVAFSQYSKNPIIKNHIECFINSKEIDNQYNYKEMLLSKRMKEEILKKL